MRDIRNARRLAWAIALTLACGTVAPAAAHAANKRPPRRLGEPVLPADSDMRTPELPFIRAGAACPSGNACFWKQTGFDGDRAAFDDSFAGVWRDPGNFDRSTKNEFGNRMLRLGEVQSQRVDIVECLDP